MRNNKNLDNVIAVELDIIHLHDLVPWRHLHGRMCLVALADEPSIHLHVCVDLSKQAKQAKQAKPSNPRNQATQEKTKRTQDNPLS